MIATGHDLVIYSYTELVERNELKNTEITTFILRLIVKQTNVFDCGLVLSSFIPLCYF